MTDDLFTPLTPANPAAPAPRVCRKHVWVLNPVTDEMRCNRCPKVYNAIAVRRGRTNRSRGNAIERQVGKSLGLKRVGQFGGATDLGESSEPFAVSVKSGSAYFSERYWDQLKRQPVAANQTALLVVTDAPGAGHKRRAVVVLDLADWLALHGSAGVEGIA